MKKTTLFILGTMVCLSISSCSKHSNSTELLESTDSVSIETGSEQSGKKAFEIAASDMIDKQKIEDLENDEKISVGRDSYGNIKIIRGNLLSFP